MKSLFVTVLLLLTYVSVFSNNMSQSASNDILGVWLMANQNVKVKIYQKNNQFYGKVIWMDDDANKKNFSLGGTIFDNMKYNARTKRYESGNFYGRGYRLNCSLRLIEDNKMEVSVSKGFLHQVRYCTRVNHNEMVSV